MKELNIARIIHSLRKEKGISQDVLAEYLSVSKAAVSKWETSQSYPDIVLLPKIATYFNISVDELLGYKPQLSSKEIQKLYTELSHAFTVEPFDEVITRCQRIIQEYYSCYPLLNQMGGLYLNYANMAKDPMVLFEKARALFIKVKQECKEVNVVQQAQNLEATSLLMMQKPKELIALLAGNDHILISNEILEASAYQMIGDSEKTMSILQISMYQHMLVLIETLTSYLSTCKDEPMFQEVTKRILNIITTFHVDTLHPLFLLNTYISLAISAMQFHQDDQALDMIEQYVNLASNKLSYTLHGDTFFTQLDDWFKATSFPIPRDESAIKKDILSILDNHSTFSKYEENLRFQSLVKRLKQSLGATSNASN